MVVATDYLRITLDPVRLAVLGHAATGSVDAVEIAARVGATEQKVLKAIGTLQIHGLLDVELSLNREALVAIARSMPVGEPASHPGGAWTPDEVEVLSRFFEGSRLKEIPSGESKRLIVLERLVQEFEPGLRYEERSVNRILQLFHPDYAALRRYLVDHDFLTRAGGVYWRTGGRYEMID